MKQETLERLEKAEKKIQDKFGVSLRDTFIDFNDVPVKEILQELVNTSMNWHEEGVDLWAIGKQLQWKHGYDVVPSRCELECSAGLWKHLKDNLQSHPL